MADEIVYANEIITVCCIPRLQCLGPKTFLRPCDSHSRYYKTRPEYEATTYENKTTTKKQTRYAEHKCGYGNVIIIIRLGGVLRDTEN